MRSDYTSVRMLPWQGPSPSSLAFVNFRPKPCDELELWVADDACAADAYRTGFLNALMIEAGYASVLTTYPFQYMDSFRRLEAEARRDQRGLWNPAPRDVRLAP